jgi:DNA-binding transcriptional MerR regulator
MEVSPEHIRPAKKLYLRKTAAQVLDMSISMLKLFEKEGLLKPIRIGPRRVYYDTRQVDAVAAAVLRGEISISTK